MEPLFKVGEEVILQSECYPERNGNCTITEVAFKNGVHIFTRERLDGWCYRLNIDDKKDPSYWDESALRKKYPPSTQSLDEIIRDINSKVKS